MTHVHPTYRALDAWGQMQDLGMGPPEPVSRPYDWLHPQGTLFVCPDCGTLWGVVAYPMGHKFRPQAKQCRLHGGGSFLSWHVTPELLARLPDAVITYEFNMLMEREQWKKPSHLPSSASGPFALQAGPLC